MPTKATKNGRRIGDRSRQSWISKTFWGFFWPTIHDAESAKKAADQGFLAALLYVFLALTPILSGEVAKIFDVLVVALAGYFSKRMWRAAPIVGLAMMIPELAFALPGGVSFRLASAAILTLMLSMPSGGPSCIPVMRTAAAHGGGIAAGASANPGKRKSATGLEKVHK